MKASRLLLCSLVLVLSASLLPAQNMVTVYSHNFESPVGPEWSKDDRELTPNHHTTFLGRFSKNGPSVGLHYRQLPFLDRLISS